MPVIMCSQKLWRIVRSWDPPVAADVTTGATTGPWAATLCRDGSRQLVIAIDSQTYLPVVFPLGSPTEFHACGADALGGILEDIGVPADRIAVETDALRSAPFVRLKDDSLREPLKAMEFMCDIELNYHSDLRRIQVNLGEYPHAPPPHYVPVIAARSAFVLVLREPLS